MRRRERLGCNHVVAERQQARAEDPELRRVAVGGDHGLARLEKAVFGGNRDGPTRLDVQHARRLVDLDTERLGDARHAASQLCGIQDRGVGRDERGVKAIGVHQRVELGTVHQPRRNTDRDQTRLFLLQFRALRVGRRHPDAAVALEVAGDTVVGDEALDRAHAGRDHVVHRTSRLGSVLLQEGGKTRVHHVREAAVATACAVAAARTLEQHHPAVGLAPGHRDGGRQAGEAPAHDRDVGPCGAAQRGSQRLLAQARRIEPVAVDEVLVEGGRTSRVTEQQAGKGRCGDAEAGPGSRTREKLPTRPGHPRSLAEGPVDCTAAPPCWPGLERAPEAS